ncbi:hypothetical protein SAY86_022749 [Trapa natans]|uniref:Uncharacterized protein n=1 Tax=Trapa natans TaxID=22666 RepID=A0AAN7LW47_TRANT|nr:hypothetical protein SAY86_022749 [Trapa natans]
MEIKAVSPVPFHSSLEFSFNSATSTPSYITAPSSPRRFGNSIRFYSSSSAAAADIPRTSFSINLSLWEEEEEEEEGRRRNCGVSCNSPMRASGFTDFEFEFGGSKLDRLRFDPALAGELFDRGRIKPMKMMTPQLKRGYNAEPPPVPTTAITRVCDILAEEWEGDDDKRPMNPGASSTSAPSSSCSKTFSALLSAITNPKGYRKWSFRDFLLFRSASEGRGTSKDPLRKFPALGEKIERNDIFGGSMKGTASFRKAAAPERRHRESRRRRRGAHELYYWENRAAAEGMKRTTLLPYKQGLLGSCLGFNLKPGDHDLARGFGSLHPQD